MLLLLLQDLDPKLYSTWLHSHPEEMEKSAIRILISMLKDTNGSQWQAGYGVHVAHLSDAGMVEELQAAKAAGVRGGGMHVYVCVQQQGSWCFIALFLRNPYQYTGTPNHFVNNQRHKKTSAPGRWGNHMAFDCTRCHFIAWLLTS